MHQRLGTICKSKMDGVSKEDKKKKKVRVTMHGLDPDRFILQGEHWRARTLQGTLQTFRIVLV